jgi:hypothetical protein
MTNLEYLQLAAKAAEYEALYLRAREASRGHQVGLERVLRRLRRVESELRLERADRMSQLGRLWGENASLRKKVERLSLQLMSYWSQE